MMQRVVFGWLMLSAALATPAGAEKIPEAKNPALARVGEVAIREAEVAVADNLRRRWRERFGPELTARRARSYRREELQTRILGLLVEHFGREQRIVAEDEEVAAYADYLQGLLEKRSAQLKPEKLREEGASASRQGFLAEIRQRILADSREVGRIAARARDQDGIDAAATSRRERNIRETIRRWKTRRALYRRYGGRVVMGRGDLVPVGAIQALLEERLATYYVILPGVAEQDLFDDFRVPDPSGAFPVTRAEAESYWVEPWWLRLERRSRDGAAR